MSKKKLKKRIRELEAENIMLRAMQSYPIYIYLYRDIPYNPYWQPYQPYQPYRFTNPIWKVEPTVTYPDTNQTYKVSGTTEICGDWQVYSSTFAGMAVD